MKELHYQIDLLNAMNQKLNSEEKMLRLIANTSSNAFWYHDFTNGKIQMLGNWNSFFPFPVQTLSELQRLYDFCEEEYVNDLRHAVAIETTGEERIIVQFKTKDKGEWFECEANAFYDYQNKPTQKILRFRDITKFMAQNDELKYMAYYDTLTNLYNRNYFVVMLSKMIERAKKHHKVVSVMFMDLDNFRKINDSLGLIVGDELVQGFGQYLAELSSEDVICSHFNSDLFCVAIYDSIGVRSVDQLYRQIKKRLEQPFKLTNGQEILLSVSVGVAEYPHAAMDVLELINCAEIVMFKAKEGGKGNIRYFDTEILQEFLHSFQLENKLKKAVSSLSFLVYYQPQYRTGSKKLRGVEALLRWRDTDGNMISPGEFIPVAENNGSIIAIGNFVMDEAIRQFMEWKKTYHCAMILSINISSIQYKQDDFIDHLLYVIKKYQMEPTELELEITESVIIDDYKVIQDKLLFLRDVGIRISLDDFGTGFSSLAYLKGLPIDTIKIDKSFVDTVEDDENTKIIMDSVMYMAKKMHLETIAEGIETQSQYEYLEEIKCDNIQGYYFGKPMPSESIEALIKSQI